ncbi:MAG TPA: site-2 protease family protein [Candidatus Saccharimonadales bacterium]
MDITYILIVLGVILFSMTLHEAMHGFVAYWLGDDTAKLQGRLTLNPIKHIDPFLTILLPLMLAAVGAPIFGGAKPVPFNPARVKYDEWGAALVALAGPLTNFIIAFIFFGAWVVSGAGNSVTGEILMVAVMVNLGFFVFNMLPIPPLDGSRVVYALAPDFVRSGMEAIERYGIIFIFTIVLLASRYIGQFMLVGIETILNIFQAVFALV